jgi:hypothetical protein
MRLQAGAKYPSSESADCSASLYGRSNACSTAPASEYVIRRYRIKRIGRCPAMNKPGRIVVRTRQKGIEHHANY